MKSIEKCHVEQESKVCTEPLSFEIDKQLLPQNPALRINGPRQPHTALTQTQTIYEK